MLSTNKDKILYIRTFVSCSYKTCFVIFNAYALIVCGFNLIIHFAHFKERESRDVSRRMSFYAEDKEFKVRYARFLMP